jgi:hypothetical protein
MQTSSLRLTHLSGAIGVLALGTVLVFWAPWSAQARGDFSPRASNVAVNCDPSQQPLVRQTVLNGELNVAIQCVTAGQTQPVGYVDQFGRPVQPMPGLARAVPAVYTLEPTSASPSHAPQPTADRPVATRSVEKRRSWQRRALIIGGSAGTGAGIGGLVGGKKGALIGAAIGGGGAALYEAVKDK